MLALSGELTNRRLFMGISTLNEKIKALTEKCQAYILFRANFFERS